MKRKILPIVMLSLFSVFSIAEDTENVTNVQLTTFVCTDEEVNEYLDQSKNPLINQKVTPEFKDFKKAFQEVKKEEEKKTGSGPGGCLTIFDTYKFPKLPDDFFNFDPSSITDIGSAIVNALQEALKDGYCYVIGGEFFEKQMDDYTDYNKKLKEKGIKKKYDPWMPQIMKKQLREKFAGDKYGRLKADALNFADPNQEKSMQKYFQYTVDDALDEVISN